MTSKRQPHRRSLSLAKLDEMIEEATVDAYGESEQSVGFFTHQRNALAVAEGA